jgi:hypothetical protein
MISHGLPENVQNGQRNEATFHCLQNLEKLLEINNVRKKISKYFRKKGGGEIILPLL